MQIQLTNVSFTYMPDTPYEKLALRDINLTINHGEVVGIIGHTGSGKSTLIQHFNRLLKPTKGKILVDGLLVTGKKPSPINLSHKVGLVFQYPEYQLFAENVYEDVAFGPRNLGIPEDKIPGIVKKALNMVGLDETELGKRSPFSLSGGQKRRVAIAGVIAMEPEMLVLDEPTAGLDPRGRKEIIQLVKEYHQQSGNTVVWVSHNMNEVARLVKRLIVMDRGEIFQDGSPADIFQYEEALRERGLSIPEAASLVRRLRQKGKPIKGQAITVEEAFLELKRWLGGKNHD